MRGLRWLVMASAVMASTAFAQRVRTHEKPEPGDDRDIEVKLQGGLVTYTGEAARLTSPGASYGVLVATDLFGAVDGELSYQGAAYGTDASLGGRNTILENGGQALLMLSPTFGKLEPYVFTGLSLARLNILESRNSVSQIQDSTRLKLPLGVGIDFVPAGDGGGEVDLLLGARVKYDVTLAGGAFPTLDSRMSENQLQTTLQVGATF